MTEFFENKKYLPYIIVFVSFCLIIFLTVVVIDWLILPALIHNSDNVKVPYILGKTVPEAEKILSASGLSVAKVTEQYSDQVPQGIVINQVPKAGQQIKAARNIYLTVSKGQESVFVPYVVGQPSRTARILLKNKGLDIGNIEYANNDTFGPDTVVLQKTASGKQLAFGSRVDLVISKGAESQVKVPLIEGNKLDDAIKLLNQSGLQAGTITWVKNETYLPNTVIKQNPSAGVTVSKASIVDISVVK